jgi:GGDEF domain-containing protein
VAGKLAVITGGGRAYRVGGEEFSILFPGKTAKDAMPHLELLRSVIEVSTFRVRASQERRRGAHVPEPRKVLSRQEGQAQDFRGQDSRGQDRRSSERRTRARRAAAPRRITQPVRPSEEAPGVEISVTVSIGVAEPRARIRAVEDVIQAADQALYRAKQSGRNRVEFAAVARVAKIKRNIA